MRRVEGAELEAILPHFEAAAEIAVRALCLRARCGSVIVKDGIIIGSGYNAPPLEDEQNRTCNSAWDYAKKPKFDLTCCIHAEWNAILDACKRHPAKIQGSTLYFMRVDEQGNFTDAGEPYCTTCSRLTLQSGVGEFALWNAGGAAIYDTTEYNHRSYAFYDL